jgi:hypothetical protein
MQIAVVEKNDPLSMKLYFKFSTNHHVNYFKNLDASAEYPSKYSVNAIFVSGFQCKEKENINEFIKEHFPNAKWIIASVDPKEMFESLNAYDFLNKRNFAADMSRIMIKLEKSFPIIQ